MKKTRLAFWMGTLCLLSLSQAGAEPFFLDLSKSANMGLTVTFEPAADLKAAQEKSGFSHFPVGLSEFRGIPFEILDPSKNQGHSLVVLKGRRQSSYPEAVSIPAGGLKAVELYFLHTCWWGGTAPDITMAEYDVLYEDGTVEVIPLHVGRELTAFWGADDTPTSPLAWWNKYKNITMGVNVFPWKNPRPDKAIQSIVFKSLHKMPTPILLAITASDKELPISPFSPKPETILKTDTTQWIPFAPPSGSSQGTAIDMSFLLEAPAGKHGKVEADGEKLEFEDGTPARFWGLKWEPVEWIPPRDQLSKIADSLAVDGCNLVSLDLSDNSGVTENLQTLVDILKSKGIYINLINHEKVTIPAALEKDPAVITQNFWTFGVIHRNDISKIKTTPIDFENEPMVMQPEKSIISHLNFSRSLELPYRVEWLNGWPNEYLSEAPLLVAGYGCFEDWTACVGTGLLGGEQEPDRVTSDKPAQLEQWPVAARLLVGVQWPVASLTYLRGDLKSGKLYVLEARDQVPDLTTSLKAMAHRSGITGEEKIATDVSGELKAKIQPKLKSFVSDTGQITWQGNVGVVKIDAPRFQALIGFLSHRKFDNPYWSVETPNLFASLSVISLSKKALNVSDHLLITGVTRMENTGMTFNQNKTKMLSAGQEPVLIEPLQAKITLYRLKKDPALKARALDANGQPLKVRVTTRWTGNSLSLSWVPEAFYLEVYRR